MIKLKNSEIVLVLIYKILLDISYAFTESTLWGYTGFEMVFNTNRLIIGWFFFLITYFLIRDDHNDICTLFCHVIFFVSITPFLVIYQFCSFICWWMVLLQTACIVYMNILFRITRRFKSVRIRGFSYKSIQLRYIIGIGQLFYLSLTIIKLVRPCERALSYFNSYDTRAAVNLSALDSIIQNVICKIVGPACFLLSVNEMKWSFAAFIMLIQVYTYAVTGFKTYLFILVVLIGIQFFKKSTIKQIILTGLPLALFAADIGYRLTGSVMVYALIGNRVFFTPALIKYCYFDYFSKHDSVHFSQNTISKIFGVTSNYDRPVPNIIGETYFGKPNQWTSTGFMSDAFANGGIGGVFLIATVLSIVLIILRFGLKYVSEDLQVCIQSIFLIFFITLNDGTAISVLFSGGMLLTVILIYIVDFRKRKANCESD